MQSYTFVRPVNGMKFLKSIFLLMCVWLCMMSVSRFGLAADWRIDTQQAAIHFKTTGMLKVDGEFSQFSAQIRGDLFEPENLTIELSIPVASLSTGNKIADEVLKGSTFFNVKQYPTATFSSRSIRKLDAQNMWVYGDLTLAGLTRPINFKVKLEQPQLDQQNQTIRVQSSAVIQINRTDWGMRDYSAVIDPMVTLFIDAAFISHQ